MSKLVFFLKVAFILSFFSRPSHLDITNLGQKYQARRLQSKHYIHSVKTCNLGYKKTKSVKNYLKNPLQTYQHQCVLISCATTIEMRKITQPIRLEKYVVLLQSTRFDTRTSQCKWRQGRCEACATSPLEKML